VQLYDLYGVLVHVGHSVHSGHYYCFVRAGNGLWHKCDDTSVGQCSERSVLSQNAYILFYIRRNPRHHLPPSAPPKPKPAPLVNGNHASKQQPEQPQSLPNGKPYAAQASTPGQAKQVQPSTPQSQPEREAAPDQNGQAEEGTSEGEESAEGEQESDGGQPSR
jgi:ubiquitin carboxyl-terminal hydrolase 36/42